jgi:hypothetical protein
MGMRWILGGLEAVVTKVKSLVGYAKELAGARRINVGSVTWPEL